MLTTIHITVCDRVPTITAGEDVISHNSDYIAEFVFDEEWQDKVKTVYFVCEDGSYQAVVMSGNLCDVPMMAGEHRRIFVGVQAGSAEKPSVLKTTRPCCLKVKDSIADYLGQPIPDPTPDVYEQIIAMLNNLTAPTWEAVKDKPFTTLGDGLSVENGVLSAKGGTGGSPNAVQYVAQELTDEQKTQARENIGAGTSSFSGSYNDLTSKPTIPTQVTIDSTLKQSGQAADAKAVGDALQHFTPTETLNSEFRVIELTFATKLDKNQGTENAGKILGVGEDGNVIPQDEPTYTLPQATADALGGIKADAATAEDTQDVRVGADGKLRTKPSGGSTVTVDSELSATSVNPVQNKVVTAALAEKITAPTTAAVGQIIKVKSVDTSGKPTEWECADLPSGGGGAWEELIDTTIEASEGITAISLNLPKSDIAKGYACQLEFTKSTGDAWAGNANMTPRINGALMGYYLFSDDLSKNSINYFAIGNFETLGNGYIDFSRHVYSLESNQANVIRQLGANRFTAKVTGKFEMGFTGKTYIGTAKIKIWGRYK